MSTINVQPTIFREYIGGNPESNTGGFPNIIKPNVKEFHFILAFAKENYDETTQTGTGTFNPSWNQAVFNVDAIRQLKENHKNAKVFISIGGRGPQYPFNPAAQWLDNATDSLNLILHSYSYSGTNLIDGIDVYYENINSSDDVFVDRIGKLIQSLRVADIIKEASIAPSCSINRQYNRLYRDYGNYINWVGYQFYSERGVSTMLQFQNLYNALSNDYHIHNQNILLAGFSTDPIDNGQIAMEIFLEGCQNLLRNNLLPGIFVWDADNSMVQNPPFVVEQSAQQMIEDFNLIF